MNIFLHLLFFLALCTAAARPASGGVALLESGDVTGTPFKSVSFEGQVFAGVAHPTVDNAILLFSDDADVEVFAKAEDLEAEALTGLLAVDPATGEVARLARFLSVVNLDGQSYGTLSAVDGLLYFVAVPEDAPDDDEEGFDSENGFETELYRSDGTVSGTEKVPGRVPLGRQFEISDAVVDGASGIIFFSDTGDFRTLVAASLADMEGTRVNVTNDALSFIRAVDGTGRLFFAASDRTARVTGGAGNFTVFNVTAPAEFGQLSRVDLFDHVCASSAWPAAVGFLFSATDGSGDSHAFHLAPGATEATHLFPLADNGVSRVLVACGAEALVFGVTDGSDFGPFSGLVLALGGDGANATVDVNGTELSTFATSSDGSVFAVLERGENVVALAAFDRNSSAFVEIGSFAAVSRTDVSAVAAPDGGHLIRLGAENEDLFVVRWTGELAGGTATRVDTGGATFAGEGMSAIGDGRAVFAARRDRLSRSTELWSLPLNGSSPAAAAEPLGAELPTVLITSTAPSAMVELEDGRLFALQQLAAGAGSLVREIVREAPTRFGPDLLPADVSAFGAGVELRNGRVGALAFGSNGTHRVVDLVGRRGASGAERVFAHTGAETPIVPAPANTGQRDLSGNVLFRAGDKAYMWRGSTGEVVELQVPPALGTLEADSVRSIGFTSAGGDIVFFVATPPPGTGGAARFLRISASGNGSDAEIVGTLSNNRNDLSERAELTGASEGVVATVGFGRNSFFSGALVSTEAPGLSLLDIDTGAVRLSDFDESGLLLFDNGTRVAVETFSSAAGTEPAVFDLANGSLTLMGDEEFGTRAGSGSAFASSMVELAGGVVFIGRAASTVFKFNSATGELEVLDVLRSRSFASNTRRLGELGGRILFSADTNTTRDLTRVASHNGTAGSLRIEGDDELYERDGMEASTSLPLQTSTAVAFLANGPRARSGLFLLCDECGGQPAPLAPFVAADLGDDGDENGDASSDSGLSGGEVASIAIGAMFAVVVLAGAALVFLRRGARQAPAKAAAAAAGAGSATTSPPPGGEVEENEMAVVQETDVEGGAKGIVAEY